MKLTALTSKPTYAAMAAMMALDAVLYAIPAQFVTEGLDKVDFPRKYRWIFPPIKAASAIGLLIGTRVPWMARLTTAMLTLYFGLAVGSHIRSRDFGSGFGAASTFLAIFTAMAALGPRKVGR